MPPVIINILGIVAILAIAFLLSTGKKRIKLRIVGAAFALQALMAFLVSPAGQAVLAAQGFVTLPATLPAEGS